MAVEADWLSTLLNKAPAWLAGAGTVALGAWGLIARMKKSVSADDTSTQAHTAWSQIIVEMRAEISRLQARVKELEAEREEWQDLIAELRAAKNSGHMPLNPERNGS